MLIVLVILGLTPPRPSWSGSGSTCRSRRAVCRVVWAMAAPGRLP
ncbi:hypothetical protein [Inquilinus ginsengisoli]